MVMCFSDQIGMDRTNEKVEKASEYIFRFQQSDGGFSSSTYESALRDCKMLRKKGKKLPSREEFASPQVHEHEYSCLTGNVVTALTSMDYGEDQSSKSVRLSRQDLEQGRGLVVPILACTRARQA
jgi:hypothetical protein